MRRDRGLLASFFMTVVMSQTASAKVEATSPPELAPDRSVVLKTRAHYYALGPVVGFALVYLESESQLTGRHGLGLSADLTWTQGASDVWGKGSAAFDAGLGLNYRHVFDDDYDDDDFYIHLSAVLRRHAIDYSLADGTARNAAESVSRRAPSESGSGPLPMRSQFSLVANRRRVV